MLMKAGNPVMKLQNKDMNNRVCKKLFEGDPGKKYDVSDYSLILYSRVHTSDLPINFIPKTYPLRVILFLSPSNHI